MLKKFLCALLCFAAIFTLCFCSEKNEKITPDENVNEAVEENKENTKDNGFYNVELNIKPLEEVEAETLSESAKTLGFENEKLFHAFSNAIGKKPSEVTKEDVDKVHYIAVGTENEEKFSIYVGYINYVDLCLSDKRDDPDFASMLSNALMMSEFSYDAENDSLYDLGNFKNIEMFEIYDVKIDDVSFIKNYNTLIYGFFKNNGITDVSSLSDFAPETLVELDFTGNEISDYSALSHIKEKVLVLYDLESGFRLTLDSYLEQKENPQSEPEVSDDKEASSTENEGTKNEGGLVFVDENGNETDFSSLFD